MPESEGCSHMDTGQHTGARVRLAGQGDLGTGHESLMAKPPSRLQSGGGLPAPEVPLGSHCPPRLPSSSIAALIACQDSGICPGSVAGSRVRPVSHGQPHAPVGIMLDHAGEGFGGMKGLRPQADAVGTERSEGCLRSSVHTAQARRQRLHPLKHDGPSTWLLPWDPL